MYNVSGKKQKTTDKTAVSASGWLGGYRLLVDEDGNSVVSGVFPGWVQFGPTLLTSSWTGSNGFLAFLNLKGKFKSGARAIVSSKGSATAGMARDKTGGLYVVGQFAGTANIGGTTLKSKGAAKVILTAPGKGSIKNIVSGVNGELIDHNDTILAAASCTTNAIVPPLKDMAAGEFSKPFGRARSGERRSAA